MTAEHGSRGALKAGLHESPLPRLRLLPKPAVAGRIKDRPEDFIVEEIPLYEPTGSGEHLMLRVQKIGLSHGEMIRRLARHFRVHESEIGFAGMKDKQAVTTQCVSIHTPENFGADDVIDERITVAWSARHRSKLRRGHLAGNRFAIRIRNVDPIKAPAIAARLRELGRRGAPNYFGSQRFGYRGNNYLLGLWMLRGDWQALLDEMLGSRGSPFPAHQAEQRDLYDRAMYSEALQRWPRSDRAEHAALRELARGRDAQRACVSMGRRALSFFGAAAQSAMFNRLLDERLAAGSIEALQQGDLAWLHRSRAVFLVDDKEFRNPELAKRVAALELSPSGPMWGPGMTLAAGAVLERERDILQCFGLSEANLKSSPCELEGARRPMRCRIENPLVDGGFDEHGPYVRVAFDLERGSFATMVLCEIVNDQSGAIHAEGEVESR